MLIAGETKRIEDWYAKAGPKDREAQWKDGHSAKEFAKMWFDKDEKISEPKEIKSVIENIFGKHEILFAVPEHITPIDNFAGGQRNHDMFLFCRKENSEYFVVCIETKVDEPSDVTIQKKLDDVKEIEKTKKSKSKIPERIKLIQQKLEMENAEIGNLRYQLFTGLVGAIKEAENFCLNDCMFLVLQIIPEKTIIKNLEERVSENYQDVKNFLKENSAGIISEKEKYLVSKVNCNNKNLNTYLCYAKAIVK